MTRISLDLPEDLARRLGERALEQGYSRNELILRALRQALDGEDALDAWIAEGEADVAACRTVSLEEAMASAQEIIAEARRKTQA